MLALRCRSIVLPGFGIREPEGRIGIHFEQGIEMLRTKDLRADLVTNPNASPTWWSAWCGGIRNNGSG